MPSNCYSFGFPSVHAYLLFFLLFPLGVYWGLTFFCSGLHGYPDVEADSLGAPQGQKPHQNNQERPEQKKECSNGGTRSNTLCPEGGDRLWRALVSMTFDPEMLCLKHKTTLVLSWRLGEHSFNAVSLPEFLLCSELWHQLHLSLFPICFLVKWFKDKEEVGSSIEIVETGKLILQFIWKWQGLRITKTMLKMKEVGELALPDSKVYY